MRHHLPDAAAEPWQQRERCHRSHCIVDREQHVHPIRALVIGRAGRVGAAEHVLGHHRRGVDPHDEQCRPTEELHQRKPLHHVGHAGEIADDARQHIGAAPLPGQRNANAADDAVGRQQRAQQQDFLLQGKPVDRQHHGEPGPDPHRAAYIALACQRTNRVLGRRFLGMRKGGLLFGTVFARGDDGPQDRTEQRQPAAPEAPFHRVGNSAVGSEIAYPELFEEPREDRTDYRTGTDECGLHRIARCVLVGVEHVAHESAKRFHRDIERGIEQPQHRRGEQ